MALLYFRYLDGDFLGAETCQKASGCLRGCLRDVFKVPSKSIPDTFWKRSRSLAHAFSMPRQGPVQAQTRPRLGPDNAKTHQWNSSRRLLCVFYLHSTHTPDAWPCLGLAWALPGPCLGLVWALLGHGQALTLPEHGLGMAWPLFWPCLGLAWALLGHCLGFCFGMVWARLDYFN